MADLTTVRELIEPFDDMFERVASSMPDGSRRRFIEMALQAARNATVIDKPRHDLRVLIEEDIKLMLINLSEWATEDGF